MVNYDKLKTPFWTILFIVSFFHVELIPWSVWERDKIWFIIIPLLAILLTKGKYRYNNCYNKRLFQSLFFLIILNCITCFFFRHQSPIVTIFGWRSFLPLLFIPTFYSWRLSVGEWEKLLFILFIIILVSYILQYVFIDLELFHLDKRRDFLEVETRIRIYSDGILFLGTLYSLNKFLLNHRVSYIVLFLIAFFIVFLQGFRVLILGLALCSFLIYYRIKGFSFKSLSYYVIPLIIGLYFVRDLPIVQNKIEEIINRNDNSNFDNDSYVRVLLFEHFYTDHVVNNTEYVLGSGMTKLSVDSETLEVGKNILSNYSKEMSELAAYNHFFYVDAGLIGLSWFAGIPFVLLYVYFLITMIKQKVPPGFYYIGAYEILCLLSGATHAMSYWHSNIIFHVILFMILLNLANKKPKKSSCDHRSSEGKRKPCVRLAE